jgi:hypothetical protein
MIYIRDPEDIYYRHQGIHYGIIQGQIAATEAAFEFYRMRLTLKGLT